MQKIIGLLACVMGLTVMGQTMPATQNSRGFPDITVSEMKVETLEGFPFLYFKKTMTVDQMSQTLGLEIHKMVVAMKASSITPRGPLVILMHGVTADPSHSSHPIQIMVGFKVNAGTVAPANYEMSDLPASECAISLYSGPLAQVKLAYQKLYPGIFGAGLTPTGNIREYILYYETPESFNNVAMAAVELQ